MAAGPATLEAPPEAARERPRRAGRPETAATAAADLSTIDKYHKGLQHDADGEVVQQSYQSLLKALAQPTRTNFESILLGPGGRKLVNPQAGFAVDLEGPNPSKLTMPTPPAVGSAEAAGEAVELYWMALLRDVPFAQFGSDPTVAQAAAELSGLTDFKGPKVGGSVTPATIFRGLTPGDLNGPYVSQFLLMPIPYGSLTI
ncbi:MAG: phosphoesterase, partial [Gemmatimonadota bacterium]|nr:phosphoesterase [Gemmatimonadota bacterium]